jgi:DNA-binding NarL/FixJ family response regulator
MLPIMGRPRVLIADDHVIVAEGLRRLLEASGEVVGVVHDGRALLEEATRLKPEVIVVDVAMPLLNGIDAARRLRKTAPRAKIIFLTMHADGATIAGAFRAGASGYVLKHSAPDELVDAVAEVVAGHCYITPRIDREVIDWALRESRRDDAGGPAQAQPELTSRQREVLQLVAEGRSAKEIAQLLHVSTKTVEFHKSRLKQALGVHTTAELTRHALRLGIVRE